MELSLPVGKIAGVGEKLDQAFSSLGVKTVKDLLWHIPFRYVDATSPIFIVQARIGQVCCLELTVSDIKLIRSPKKAVYMVNALGEDKSGKISIIWFNQRYLITSLKENQTLVLIGKITYDFAHKQLQLLSPQILFLKKVMPIYHLSSKLTSAKITKILSNIKPEINKIADSVPEKILVEFNQIPISVALNFAHFPQNVEETKMAFRRFAFDELLIVTLGLRQIIPKLKNNRLVIKSDIAKLKKFVSDLPFRLTDDQRKTSWQILRDLNQPTPMKRLLMGDVGSGKTIVAIISALTVVLRKKKVVWLTPTEILASQHFETTKKFLTKDIKVGILTGSRKKNELEKMDIIIGTHALLFRKETLNNIGLVIVDEQHKFGVNQRESINNLTKYTPHFLSMTATPIPRTLALTLYGDLKLSVINEMPLNRKKIISKLYSSSDRKEAYEVIKREVEKGRQAFVVTPLIEEQEDELENLFDEDRKAVVKEAQYLKNEIFSEFNIGILHGKMNSMDKNKIMSDFESKKIDILVCTSVVEVGIDIPNATVILIENAELFGLASLHQIRGRVGRSNFQSYCLFITNTKNEKAMKRLKYLEDNTSGIKLAEFDLQERGPGALLGLNQSGFPELHFFKYYDNNLIKDIKDASDALVKEGLSPALKRLVEANIISYHQE